MKIEELKKWFEEEMKKNNKNYDDFARLEIADFNSEGMGYGIKYIGEEKEYYIRDKNDYKISDKVLFRVPGHLLLNCRNEKKYNPALFNKLSLSDGWIYEQILNILAKQIKWLKENTEHDSLKDIEGVEKLKEMEFDPKILTEKILMTFILAYLKKNRQEAEKHSLGPYITFLCELPEQGNVERIRNYFALFKLKEIILWSYDDISKKENIPNPHNDSEWINYYEWASTIIETRATGTDEKEVVLPPIADFFNHKTRVDRNVETNPFTSICIYDEKKNLTEFLIAPQPGEKIKLTKNEQIFLCYGNDVSHHKGINEEKAQIQINPK